MSTPRTDPDPENDSETCCKCCGDEYALRDGCEPTKYCDLCAHKMVDCLESELAEAKVEVQELRRQMTVAQIQAAEFEIEARKAK